MLEHPSYIFCGDAPHQPRQGLYIAKLVPGEEPVAIPLQPGNDLSQAQAHLITKARSRWLKGQELYTLLQLCKEGVFPYSMTPATRPLGGTLFLYDRKVVRFFRLDGHNWRKKNDNKTVRETHEKLKLDNVDSVNCYYAHAIEPVTLQRRCYWLLENDNHVLVHYLQTIPQEEISYAQGQQAGWADHFMIHHHHHQKQQHQYMPINQSLNIGLGVPFPLSPSNVPQHAIPLVPMPQNSMMGIGDIQNMTLMTEQMMRDHTRNGVVRHRSSPDSATSSTWCQGGNFQMTHLPWEGLNDFVGDFFQLASTPMGFQETGVAQQQQQMDALAINSLSAPLNWWDPHKPTQQTEPKTIFAMARGPGQQPMQMVLTASHGRNSPSFQPQKVSRTSLEISVTNRAPLEASIGSPWLNIWEMSPEVASPDGNTRVILAGSPSPGFDMIRELFVDVGGQKVPATILQGGMLAFLAPQRPPGHIHIMVTDSFGHVVSSSTVLKFQYPRRASCSDAIQPREEKSRGLSAVWAASLPGHPENNNNSVHQVDLVSNFVSTKIEPSNGHIGAALSLTSAKRRSDAGGMMDCPYLQEPGTY